MTNHLDLPAPISAYFEADGRDAETLMRCFTADAVVKDEGHAHAGRKAIRSWKEEASRKYTYTSEPFACAQKGGATIVTVHLAGDFPGSPTDLRFAFRLERGLIASLEVTP